MKRKGKRGLVYYARPKPQGQKGYFEEREKALKEKEAQLQEK